jgi:hypothetical protein
VNADFRLAVDFADCPKVEKIVRRLGDSSFRCVVRLFGWCARNRPDGILLNLDVEDIAIAAGWLGDAEAFCHTLSEVRLIDRSDVHHCFALHDWRDHNPWAAEANGRSDHARRVNHERWHVDRGRVEAACALCTPGVSKSVDQTTIRTESDGESPTESSSLFVSSPKTKKKRTPLFAVDSDAYRLADLLLRLIRERDPKAKGDPQRWAEDTDKLLRIDGRTPKEVEAVIHWCQADSFWRTNCLSAARLRHHFSQLLQRSTTTRAEQPAAFTAPNNKRSAEGTHAAINSFFAGR